MAGGTGDTQKKQRNLAQEQTGLGQQAQSQSSQMFDLSFPWMQQSGSYYKTLASGDPEAIQRAIAPGAEKIATATTGAEKNINALYPRGGTRDLALQEAEIGKAGQIGQLGAQEYTQSFQNLAKMAGVGQGLSINQFANAIAGLGQASGTLGQIGQEQAAGKGSMMGFLGSLASAGGEIGAAAVAGT